MLHELTISAAPHATGKTTAAIGFAALAAQDGPTAYVVADPVLAEIMASTARSRGAALPSLDFLSFRQFLLAERVYRTVVVDTLERMPADAEDLIRRWTERSAYLHGRNGWLAWVRAA